MAGTIETEPGASPGAAARWHGSLSALLPEGWLAEEVIQMQAPDGSISVNVAAGPTPQSLDELVERYGSELAQLPGYREVSLEPAVVMAGRGGRLRTFTWNPDDERQLVQMQSYVVEGEAAFVATAVAPSEVYESRRDLIVGLLKSVDTTPLSFEVSAASRKSHQHEPLASFLAGITRAEPIRGSKTAKDWSETARSWRSGASSEESTAEIDLSADELEALAQLYGFDTFPGIGRDGFSHFSSETRIVAGRAARRSLLAHGVVRLDDQGTATVLPPVDAMLKIGLEPALAVTHERQTREGQSNTILLADHETLVEHVQLFDGSHHLSSYPASSLLARLTGRLDLGDDGSDSDRSFQASVVDLCRSVESGEQLSGETRLRVVALDLLTVTYETDDKMAGGWVGWFLDHEGQLWQLDSEEDPESPARLVSTTRVKLEDEILSYLPGMAS